MRVGESRDVPSALQAGAHAVCRAARGPGDAAGDAGRRPRAAGDHTGPGAARPGREIAVLWSVRSAVSCCCATLACRRLALSPRTMTRDGLVLCVSTSTKLFYR